MSTELFKIALAFRGLSDEDEDEAALDEPATLDDDDEEEDGLGEGVMSDEEPASSEE